jgi:hypothetical protein
MKFEAPRRRLVSHSPPIAFPQPSDPTLPHATLTMKTNGYDVLSKMSWCTLHPIELARWRSNRCVIPDDDWRATVFRVTSPPELVRLVMPDAAIVDGPGGIGPVGVCREATIWNTVNTYEVLAAITALTTKTVSNGPGGSRPPACTEFLGLEPRLGCGPNVYEVRCGSRVISLPGETWFPPRRDGVAVLNSLSWCVADPVTRSVRMTGVAPLPRSASWQALVTEECTAMVFQQGAGLPPTIKLHYAHAARAPGGAAVARTAELLRNSDVYDVLNAILALTTKVGEPRGSRGPPLSPWSAKPLLAGVVMRSDGLHVMVE